MNIFFVDIDPYDAARMLCDKHVVKMIMESAQLLSTAWRVLEGRPYYGLSKKGRRKMFYYLQPYAGISLDNRLYNATHVNHPCAVWVRENNSNFSWLATHLHCLSNEYSLRYNKVHKCENDGLISFFMKYYPPHIKLSTKTTTDFPQCMPDMYKDDDPESIQKLLYW